MALFADGPASTIDDLTNQDSGLLEVSEVCGINVSTKLALAHEEIESELQLWLDRPRPTVEPIFISALRREQIVTTTPLKRWETMTALALFYRDACFSQLADRYQARRDEYSRLSRDARESFLASGLGLVSNPVPRASLPQLGTTSGTLHGGTFYASVAWVNSSGQEGAASLPASLAVPNNNLMTVAGVNPPACAVGFNVYAGSSITGMVAQNDIPLQPQSAFTYIPGFRTEGRLPGPGQRPDFVRPLARTLLRG
jgi:hypothetical protein